MSDVYRFNVVQEARKLIDSGRYKYRTGDKRPTDWDTDLFMDCSEFVYTSYKKAGYSNYPILGSRAIYDKAQRREGGFSLIQKEEDVLPGDIVYWPGHVGIVEDPERGTFLGAQSSGLHKENYRTGYYWSKRVGRKFIRYSFPSMNVSVSASGSIGSSLVRS